MLDNLLEFHAGPAHLDRASGVLRGTVIITSISQNGRGKGGRRYAPAAMKQIASMAEGAAHDSRGALLAPCWPSC